MTEAENTADMRALARRVRRAIHEAEVPGLVDVRRHLDVALELVARHAAKDEVIADEGAGAKSIGEHRAVA